MNVGYLYVTSNDVNNLLYIGQSGRMDDHSVRTYLGSGDYFQRAVTAIGAEHFTKRIVGFYDDQSLLDYAEVHLIAMMRAQGMELYNGGVGGPRAQRPFIRAMAQRFGVVPPMAKEWFDAVAANPGEVVELLSSGEAIDSNDFYREYQAQLLQTQDLSGECPGCGAEVGAVCRTKTGNPSRNHAGRRPTI